MHLSKKKVWILTGTVVLVLAAVTTLMLMMPSIQIRQLEKRHQKELDMLLTEGEVQSILMWNPNHQYPTEVTGKEDVQDLVKALGNFGLKCTEEIYDKNEHASELGGPFGFSVCFMTTEKEITMSLSDDEILWDGLLYSVNEGHDPARYYYAMFQKYYPEKGEQTQRRDDIRPGAVLTLFFPLLWTSRPPHALPNASNIPAKITSRSTQSAQRMKWRRLSKL